MQSIQYTGPALLDQLVSDARDEMRANPRRIRALRLVCEARECTMVACDYALVNPVANILTPDLEDWSYELYGHRKMLNPAYRREICVIDRPQYFVNLAGFLGAPGELVVLVCQPDHSDTHPELDLSSIMRRDLRPTVPPMRPPVLY
jgi:hypothetical protein